MLQTRRETNRNFILWQAVTSGEPPFFTPSGPVDWRHEIVESPEWPDEIAQEPPATWETMMEGMTPSDEELARLAADYPPPQQWFEVDEQCPF